VQWFIVEAADRPGELARVTEAIAKRDINLSSIVCLALGDRGGAAFSAMDEMGLRQALDDAGMTFREVSSVAVRMPDRPGQAAMAARSLADAGVNIELLAPIGMTDGEVVVAIGVDNAEKARNALGDRIADEASVAMTGARR
jgi:hypothetical protein